ncbi:MAG: hypothetical protein ABGW78_11805, partial [Pirellulales bacterium]
MRNSYSAFFALALLFQSPLAQCDDTDTRLIPSLDPSTFRTSLNEIHIEHDNQSRRLLVVTPHDFEKDSIYPVLLCFHGAGGRAEGQARRWAPLTTQHNMLLVSVEAVQPLAKWNFMDGFHAVDHDDVGLVLTIVKTLISYGIADPKAMYATGHSSGGLFCYRLAKESSLFAAVCPMSCGMAKGSHDPDDQTTQTSIMQVIGDQDKSFHGSTTPRITMYSSDKRIDIWRRFLACDPDPITEHYGKKIVLHTYVNKNDIAVAICKVEGEGHHIQNSLRSRADFIALEFMLHHK